MIPHPLCKRLNLTIMEHLDILYLHLRQMQISAKIIASVHFWKNIFRKNVSHVYF